MAFETVMLAHLVFQSWTNFFLKRVEWNCFTNGRLLVLTFSFWNVTTLHGHSIFAGYTSVVHIISTNNFTQKLFWCLLLLTACSMLSPNASSLLCLSKSHLIYILNSYSNCSFFITSLVLWLFISWSYFIFCQLLLLRRKKFKILQLSIIFTLSFTWLVVRSPPFYSLVHI